jgi:hypothetical protein
MMISDGKGMQALSIPMKAQSTIEAARETAWAPDPPLTFQPARNVAG